MFEFGGFRIMGKNRLKLLAFIIFFATQSIDGCFDSNDDVEDCVCTKSVCEQYGILLRQGIDKYSNPCENFYDYVCEKYFARHTTIDSLYKWDSIFYRNMRNFKFEKEILSERTLKRDSFYLKMAKKWYQSCMDVDSIAKRGLKPFEEIISGLGGWSTLGNSSSENSHNWIKILLYYHRRGIMPIFDLNFGYSCPNTHEMIPGIRWKTIEFSKQSLLDSVNRFWEFQKKPNLIYIKKLAALTRFYDELFEIKRKKTKLVCDFENILTIAEFQRRYDEFAVTKESKIDWLKILNDWLFDIHKKLTPASKIYLSDVESFIQFSKVLSQTSEETIVNFMHSHLATFLSQYIYGEETSFYRRYKRKQLIQSVRWRPCATDVPFKSVIAEEFIKKHILNATLTKGDNIIDRVHKSMISYVNEIKWNDNEFKQYILRKLRKTEKILGLPKYFDKTFTLQKMKLGPNYIDNILELLKHTDTRSKIAYAHSLTHENWPGTVDPTSTTAFYMPRKNLFVIPAYVFSNPFFNTFLPLAVNYGTTGFIIGHELAHALDKSAIIFDEDGKYVEEKNIRFDSIYTKQMNCLKNQYNKYHYSGGHYHYHVNGTITQNENFADNLGLKIAYEAFKTHLKDDVDYYDSLRIPFFEDTTNEQMFFISWTNYWCRHDTYTDISSSLDEIHVHAPHRYRVLGTLSNSKEFASAFNCPKHSTMNPPNKCHF